MINAVELQLIEDEVKALRLEKEVLKIKLAEAEEKSKYSRRKCNGHSTDTYGSNGAGQDGRCGR
jgi:hypothetical protein